VQDGIRLARKHRIPPQIIAFIPEHHGTTSISFFLNVAREQAESQGIHLDPSEFFYEGPVPHSRESAILMLADGCESAVRANRPSTEEEIEAIVSRIIQQRIDQHQLDESGLTLTDIQRVRESFVRTLRGMYHPRVKYPGDEKPMLPQSLNPVPPPLPHTAPAQLTESRDHNGEHSAVEHDVIENDEPDIEIRPDQPSTY
jgi:cyclic-di-AMP phosphodiesterase PgpH